MTLETHVPGKFAEFLGPSYVDNDPTVPVIIEGAARDTTEQLAVVAQRTLAPTAQSILHLATRSPLTDVFADGIVTSAQGQLPGPVIKVAQLYQQTPLDFSFDGQWVAEMTAPFGPRVAADEATELTQRIGTIIITADPKDAPHYLSQFFLALGQTDRQNYKYNQPLAPSSPELDRQFAQLMEPDSVEKILLCPHVLPLAYKTALSLYMRQVKLEMERAGVVSTQEAINDLFMPVQTMATEADKALKRRTRSLRQYGQLYLIHPTRGNLAKALRGATVKEALEVTTDLLKEKDGNVKNSPDDPSQIAKSAEQAQPLRQTLIALNAQRRHIERQTKTAATLYEAATSRAVAADLSLDTTGSIIDMITEDIGLTYRLFNGVLAAVHRAVRTALPLRDEKDQEAYCQQVCERDLQPLLIEATAHLRNQLLGTGSATS